MSSLPLGQIWSAVPTPLMADLTVDVSSVEKVIADALEGGVKGLFVGGTCGEGPWLPDRERRRLFEAAARAARGRITLAAQVSDNSVARVVDNARMAADAGMDCGIIAPPAIMLNATPDRIAAHFVEAAAACPLPVGIYDLGRHRPITIPEDRLKSVYLHPKVVLVKDSSGSPERREQALAARREKPGLRLFNGDEFRCIDYARSGYDGFMFGGAVAVTPQLRRIVELGAAGRWEEAVVIDEEMKETLFGIYGGRGIACWLTGLKHYMVRRGLFGSTASFLNYPLTAECREFIDRYVDGQRNVATPDRRGSSV